MSLLNSIAEGSMGVTQFEVYSGYSITLDIPQSKEPFI